jgi:hypothetical protein
MRVVKKVLNEVSRLFVESEVTMGSSFAMASTAASYDVIGII